MSDETSNRDQAQYYDERPGRLSCMAAWAKANAKEAWGSFTDPYIALLTVPISILIGVAVAEPATVIAGVLASAAGIVALPFAGVAIYGAIGAAIGAFDNDLPLEDGDDYDRDDYLMDDEDVQAPRPS